MKKTENEKLKPEGEIVEIPEEKEIEKIEKNEIRKNCLEILEDILMKIVKSIYMSFLFVIKIFLLIIGFILYPIKERFFNMAKNIDMYMNPYKNPNYHEI